MELQRIFTSEYVNFLSKDIIVENYKSEIIKYDETQLRRLKGIYKPESLEDRMLNAVSEYEAAIILYESFIDIPPSFAASPVLWVYLTHVDLSKYVRKMWPNLEKYDSGKNKGKIRTEEDCKKYIRDHWLISPNGPMRTSLMNLWWSVYMTVDKTLGEENKYDLTKIFFSNNGLRTRRLGTGHLGRNRNALKGVLSFIKDNPKIFNDGIENRMIWITRHFNLIGGTKPLSNMSWESFYSELENNKDHLSNIRKREDVTGPNAYV